MTKPNTESDKSIDDNKALTIDQILDLASLKSEYIDREALKQFLSDQLHSLLMDVIGEDELGGQDWLLSKRQAEERNELRYEQRTKLKELFNEKEK